jgi:hypothetical protein
MEKLRFDSEGKVIRPEPPKGQKPESERKGNAIILTRQEINKNNPAISRVIIKLGEKLKLKEKTLIKEIFGECENYLDAPFAAPSVNRDINLTGEKVIIEARETWLMYSLLEDVVKFIHRKYGKKYLVIDEGSFSNFD